MSPSLTPELEAAAALLQGRPRQSFSARARGDAPPVEAAVLVPLVLEDTQLHVWLLKRPASMRTHAGQIAFPGGRRDPEDIDTRATALREAHEEIGLAPEHAHVLGPFDDLTTPSGFTIHPHIALVAPDFVPIPSPAEVERVLRVPLRTFLGEPHGEYPRVGYDVEGEFVWGATFYIARHLAQLLAATPSTAALLGG